MALVTFVNNINVISGGLHQTSDPALQELNAGAFLISIGSGSSPVKIDMSSSFVPSEWGLTSSSFFQYLQGTSGPSLYDMSSSFSPADWDAVTISSSSFLLENIFPITTIVIGGGGSAFTYFFRGFYPTSGQYETWSGPSRNAAPPSGHVLIDITITGII